MERRQLSRIPTAGAGSVAATVGSSMVGVASVGKKINQLNVIQQKTKKTHTSIIVRTKTKYPGTKLGGTNKKGSNRETRKIGNIGVNFFKTKSTQFSQY